MDSIPGKDTISMSRKLLKLFKYYLVFNLVYLLFDWVLYILKEFDLLTKQGTTIIKFFYSSTIFTSYKYFRSVDIERLKAIKIKFWPTPICLSSSLLLFILYFICDTLMDRMIMHYGPNFYVKYLKAIQDQGNNFQLIYKDLSLKAFFIISISGTCILPAVSEELLFRGILQEIFLAKLKKPLLAITFSALLFSAMHFMPYASIHLFIMGLLYGSIYYITGSLLLPILGHFLNNLAATLLRDYPNHGISATTETEIETWLSIPVCIAGIIMCLALGYLCFNALCLDRKKITINAG